LAYGFVVGDLQGVSPVSTGGAGEMAERAPRTPNNVLRGIRENERRESRSEFAEAMARVAWETGVEVYPDGNYVQRLESGNITWPHRAYRNILEQLCCLPAHELGFAPSKCSAGDSGAASSRVNVKLREAVWESGIEVTDFARKIGVHPKTAERWIVRGIVPQPQRRWKAALILGIDESELWPETALSQEFPVGLTSRELALRTISSPSDQSRRGKVRVEREAFTPDSLFLPSVNSGLVTAIEWPVWFGIRIAHLIGLVDNWRDSTAQLDSLQTLLHREILMFDATGPDGDSIHALHNLSRRQALVTLAALPLTLTASASISVGTLSPPAATDLFLSRCAASLTACWHLLRGSDLPTVYQTLSSYLLALEGVAQKQSGYQQGAARLASQAHRICGIFALHRNQLRVREHHCKQALYYAAVASDVGSQASALISLASTYFYDSNPAQAAAVYEQASALESAMSPLQRSRVYAELSVVYGQLSREKDAIRATGLAEELYPDNPEQDWSFLYAEFTPASLSLESGLAYAALAEQYPGRGYQNKAAEIFARVDQMTTAVPDRIRFEVINHQARTAVLRGDLDAFETYLNRGLEGVVLLGSGQRRHEIQAALEQARNVWPREARVKALSDGAHFLTRDNSVGGSD
jgi:tetratricopeptide (TPR) repeat protein